MRFGKRGPRSSDVRRREAYYPSSEELEERRLLAIDLGAVPPPALPTIATKPYGVELASPTTGGGAGYSVAMLGDTSGNSFQDFLVGQPGVLPLVDNSTVPPTPIFPILAPTGKGTVYLTLGSQQAAAGPLDWASIPAQQRVGDITQLGITPQNNPVNGKPTYPYNGITFTTNSTNDLLGASVADAGVVNPTVSSLDDFLIGAPGENKAYLVFGNVGFSTYVQNQILAGSPTTTFNLDSPPTTAGATYRVLAFNGVAGGRAGLNVAGMGDVLNDGSARDIAIGDPNNGNLYLISGNTLNTLFPGTGLINVNLANVGTTIPGVVFHVPTPQPFIAVAGAGDVDGDGHQDLLIGLPGALRTDVGQAVLVYGPTTGTLASSINLPSDVNSGVVPGIVFTGSDQGEHAGYSVSTAGDFNIDGKSDYLIGSPGFRSNVGKVSLIYGGALTVAGQRFTGGITLSQIPATVPFASFLGNVDPTITQTALAGFSVSATNFVFGSNINGNDLLIGSPGVQTGIGAGGTPGQTLGQGVVYVIPAPATPGTTLTGSLIPLNLKTVETAPLNALVIENTVGAGPDGLMFGHSVSGTLPTLVPPNPTLDQDGVPDFVIGAPLEQLSTTFAGRDSGAVFAIEGAKLPGGTGSGGGGGGGGGGGSSIQRSANGQFYPLTQATTTFGNDVFVPKPSALSMLNYYPIPRRVAYHQYLPVKGFTERTLNYFYPKKYHYQARVSSGRHTAPHGVFTLGTSVFTRSVFDPGHTLRVTHPVPVVPVQLQTKKFGGGSLPKRS